MELIRDLLNYSKPCEKCAGAGKIGKDTCPECSGSGAVLDGRIMDLLISKLPDTPKARLGILAKNIYDIYGDKLEEAYKRGETDGKKGGDDGQRSK